MFGGRGRRCKSRVKVRCRAPKVAGEDVEDWKSQPKACVTLDDEQITSIPIVANNSFEQLRKKRLTMF
jgi:hypothetical protein